MSTPRGAPGAPPPAPVVACVKPVPLGEPRLERGQLAVEGMAWGLPAGERRVVSAACIAARALGAEPVALALGPEAARAGVREALALGARRGVLVHGEGRLDALLTARALAAAVQRLGGQVVLAGEASADAQQGVLGPMLAELLGVELVGEVERLDEQGGLVAHRARGARVERVRLRAPVLLTVSPRFAPAGHATSWGVGEAERLPLDAWPLRELAPDAQGGTELAALLRAEAKRAEAERFEGEPDEVAAQLARRLRAAGVQA